MNNSPKSKMLELAIPLYRMQTQLFNNVIEGIKEEDANKRLQDRTNHMIWMAGNIVNCRYWVANVLGIEQQDPNDHLFKDAKALDTTAAYPSLEELKSNWHQISPVLYDKLTNISDDELKAAYEFGMNVDFIEENKLNMVGMGLDRVSYLLGQLALTRKAIGYGAMSYDMNKDIQY